MRKIIIGFVVTLALVLASIPLAASAEVAGPLDHVVISPVTANITTGGTQQFTAVGEDSSNVTIPGLSYSWSVVNGGGSINGTGFFTASNITGTFANTVNVTATQGSINSTALATVIITAPTLDHVVISPVTASISTNGTQQFTAIGEDSANVTIPGLSYSWSVVNGGGTVNGTGFFTAGNTTGTFTNTVNVTATQGSVTKTALATVIVTHANIQKPFWPFGWLQGLKKGWKGSDTPTGFSHGEKKGWEGKDTPPGLSQDKKTGNGNEDTTNDSAEGKKPGSVTDAILRGLGNLTHENQSKGKSGNK